ncbi:hypothetical protein OsJ_10381 [Oryza sativa Japonica Group]|uniref:Uncharacterized protein n=1 Tax=Oryza sativa subsp. japonica TaxID=39947 RepID=B9F7D7_ORYSJ|nr:hypothetical protein OsJ_10381 [Oryza sativa Japonica Group]
MSVAKKEEVCSHRLGPRLDEPAVGVPIKKRPVLLSDRLLPSGMPPSMRPSSPATGMAVSVAEAGCSKDTFLNRSVSEETSAITKGNGMFNPQDQRHAKRSFIQSLTEKKGLSLDGSSGIPSRIESGTGNVAPVDDTQSQKFLSLGLRSASRLNGKINSSSNVKEEKVDQGLSSFPSADFQKDAGATNEPKSSSDSSFGRLPNLDLNVPLDPHDLAESLPIVQDSSNILYHETVQLQKAHVPPVPPVSTVSNGLHRNIASTLNLSNAYGLSNKRGAADVTLDLQLKPPARPELGINWKGLAPVPGLSLSLSSKHVEESENNAGLNLSLFGKHINESENNAPNVAVRSEPTVSAKKITREVGIPRTDKSPVEEKEPEEQSQRHVQNDVEKEQPLESQSVGLANNRAEIEKPNGAHQVPGKAALDLNSGIFPNVATANVPLSTERLRDAIRTEAMHADHEVKKSIKCEETTAAIPSPATASVSSRCSPLMATKQLPLGDRDASRAGLRVSASQPSLPTEPACCNPDEANVDCKPTMSHVNSRNAVEVCGSLQSSSNPIPEPSISNSRNRFGFDGMSQGSAEMDCSEDDDNIVSHLSTTNKPHGGTLGNNQTSDSMGSGRNLQKEHDSNTHQNCSFVTNKIDMQGISDDKRINVKDGVFPHSCQNSHQSGNVVNEESKNKQLLGSDKNTPMNNNDSTIRVKTITGSSTADTRRLSSLETSTSPKIESIMEPYKESGSCLEKSTTPKIKSKGCQSPLGEDSHPDGASSSQLHDECGMVKSASERSECDKSKPDSCRTTSVQNERDGQVDDPHWRGMGHPYVNVNRNETWERLMQSKREKNKGEYHGGRHAPDTFNQRRPDYRYGGRGVGSRGNPRNFRGPRMNESELYFDDEPMARRRRPFEDYLGHMQRIPHRRHRSSPMNNQLQGGLMRDMDIDGFSGRDVPDPRLLAHEHMEDLSDDMMEERSPPLIRTDRPYLPHRHHTRRHGSPFDRIEHDDRGMQRNMRRCGMHHGGVEGDSFEPHLHPAQLAELHAKAELTERRKFGERRGHHLRPFEGSPDDDEVILSYGADGDMDFAEGGSGGLPPGELDGRFRRHMGRDEEEEDHMCHGPHGWRDGSSNGSRAKRRRY